MAETAPTNQPESPSHKPPQNNPFVFLFSIPQCLLNKFVNFFNKKQQTKVETEKSVKRVDADESSVINTKTPDVVRFPLIKHEVPPIKLESEDVKEDTNPIILWQVYALGGFIILKWAWGKWQERKAKAKEDSPDEDDPPADD